MHSMVKPKDMSRAALVTHAGCMDGSGCAIMFLRAGGKRENIRYVAAGMVERFIKKDLQELQDLFVIFADIGLSGESLEKYADILEKRGECVLLDHHVTSVSLTGRTWCEIKQDACGTELLRRYLQLDDSSSVALANIIQDHDLWLRKDPMSTELAAFTVFVGQDVFVDRFLHRDVSLQVFDELEVEMMKIMSRRRDQFIDAAIKKSIVRDVMWNGNRCRVGYVVSPEMNVSLLLDRLLDHVPDIDVACQINIEKGSVSLRSKNGYDVSEMAKYFGGGGHKAASGHRISDQVIVGILEEIHG